MAQEIYIKVTKDGPYLLFGAAKITEKIIITDESGIPFKYDDGKIFEIKTDVAALCRCGRSKVAPFCDGSHHLELPIFEGTETADKKTPIMQQTGTKTIKGHHLTLLDNPKYCAFARFCDRGGRVWNLVMEGKNPDLAIEEANLCPAGRLLMFNNNGKLLERKEPKEVNTIEDGGLKISGPIWIKGGIKVIAEDGTVYEVRNKQTLCRCGASSNKPFCNGSHASIHWKATNH